MRKFLFIFVLCLITGLGQCPDDSKADSVCVDCDLAAFSPISDTNYCAGINACSGGGFTHTADNEGWANVCIGSLACRDMTTGDDNTGVGYSAMKLMTSGVDNACVGESCLLTNTTGSFNACFGEESCLSLTTGDGNVAVGMWALRFMQSTDHNIAIGREALENSTTGPNLAIGYQAGENMTSTGVQNVLIGNTTGNDMAGADRNTCVGYNTCRGITTGDNNTILGAQVTGLSATLANNIILADGAGAIREQFDSSGNQAIDASACRSWGSSGVTSPDTFLCRGAANTVQQINGTTGQTFNIYNTFTDATHYQRGFMRWSGNIFQVGTESLNDTNRDLHLISSTDIRLRIGGTDYWHMNTAGLLPTTDNVPTLGDATHAVKTAFIYTIALTPQASPPGSPTSGMIYTDSTPTPDALCFYNGTDWDRINAGGTDADCS